MSSVPNGKTLYEENLEGLSEEKLAEKYNTTRSVIHGRLYRYKTAVENGENDNFDFDDREKRDTEVKIGDRIGNNIVVEVDKNTKTIYCNSPSAKTLDEVLKTSRTDLDVWDVSRHIVNKWDMTNADGYTFENWQIKAWLARKEPINIFPNISPVVIPLSDLKPPLTKIHDERDKYAVTRVMVVSDPHFGFNKDPITQKLTPYHNESVLQVALDIFANNDFDYLIWGGDILDCNEWSTHFIKRPEFRQTTQPAINEAAKWLGSFVKAKPQAEHIVLKGNHDDRIETYIISNLDEIYNIVPGDSPDSEPLMSISNLLGLRRMGIEYCDSYRIGDTRFIHGDIAKKGGGMTARAHLENTISNTVFAHVHRRELVTETKRGYGDDIVETFAMCPGCTCYTDGRVPGSEEDDNWQNGIGALVFDGDKCLSHQIINIKNGKAEYNGKIYL